MPIDACEWRCGECGYSSPHRFPADICPKCGNTCWRCVACSFVLVAPVPPLSCPACGETVSFENITSYIPEWADEE